MRKFLKVKEIPYLGIPEDEIFSKLYDESHEKDDDDEQEELKEVMGEKNHMQWYKDRYEKGTIVLPK